MFDPLFRGQAGKNRKGFFVAFALGQQTPDIGLQFRAFRRFDAAEKGRCSQRLRGQRGQGRVLNNRDKFRVIIGRDIFLGGAINL